VAAGGIRRDGTPDPRSGVRARHFRRSLHLGRSNKDVLRRQTTARSRRDFVSIDTATFVSLQASPVANVASSLRITPSRTTQRGMVDRQSTRQSDLSRALQRPPSLRELSSVPILKRSPDGPYFSAGDERAFHEWLSRITCVQEVEGSGDELRLHIRGRRISSTCLRELIALFRRYGVPMHQLAQFENASNRSWFRNPVKVWYREVFQDRKSSTAVTAITSRRDRTNGPLRSGARTPVVGRNRTEGASVRQSARRRHRR
jgi:hypothetical protein